MNHEGLDKKVLVIIFFAVKNVCTKYNVLSVLNLLNVAMFQGYLFAEGPLDKSNLKRLDKSNLNRLQSITQKTTTYALKQQDIMPKIISSIKGLCLTFPSNKIIKFVQKCKFYL